MQILCFKNSTDDLSIELDGSSGINQAGAAPPAGGQIGKALELLKPWPDIVTPHRDMAK